MISKIPGSDISMTKKEDQKYLSQLDSHVKEYYKFKKKNKEKDKHHISWKNHGIDHYITTALKNYLQKKRFLK